MINEVLEKIELDDEPIEEIDEVAEEMDEDTKNLYRFLTLLDSSAKKLSDIVKSGDDVEEFLGNDPGVSDAINLLMEHAGDTLEDDDDKHDACVLVMELIIFISRVLDNISEKGRREYEEAFERDVLTNVD